RPPRCAEAGQNIFVDFILPGEYFPGCGYLAFNDTFYIKVIVGDVVLTRHPVVRMGTRTSTEVVNALPITAVVLRDKSGFCKVRDFIVQIARSFECCNQFSELLRR